MAVREEEQKEPERAQRDEPDPVPHPCRRLGPRQGCWLYHEGVLRVVPEKYGSHQGQAHAAEDPTDRVLRTAGGDQAPTVWKVATNSTAMPKLTALLTASLYNG